MQEDFASVFSSTLVLGEYEKSVLSLLSSYDKEITIITTDNYFLKFVKPIQTLFSEKGKNVNVFSFSSAQITLNKEEVFENSNIVLAIGNSELIDLCRHFCQKTNKDLVVVLTDFIISSCFKGKVRGVTENGLFETKCALPKKVIVDYNILRELSKKRLADAFCNSLSVYFSLCELEISKPIKKLDENKLKISKSYVLKALDYLSSVDKNQFENLVMAEFSISYALFILDDLLDSSSESFALALSSKTGVSIYECKVKCAEILFKIYKTALQKNLALNDCYPNYLQYVEEFSAIFKIKEDIVLKNFETLEYEQLKKDYNLIFDNGNKSQVVDDMIKKFQSVKNNYSFVYSARQKRAVFTRSDLISALKALGVFAKDFLKILFDSGVIDSVE